MLGGGERKGMKNNLEDLVVAWRGKEGAIWIIQVLPDYSFCSEVASARTWAGGQGVLAALGKWSEGSGSGPAFLLKVKVPLSLTM